MSTVSDLFAAYPNAARAVAFVELFTTQKYLEPGEKPDPDQPMDAVQIMIANGTSLDRAIETYKNVVRNEIQVDDMGDLERLKVTLVEMDHPEFRRFVAGKLGIT